LQRYVPGSDLAVDEMMLRFKGRSSLAFTQQPKPTPNGLKMIAVVDSKNGYFISGKIYARILGLSKEKIILDLVTGKNLENRTIVIDREYTTLGLVENLVKIGFQVVGTIKKYSNLPKEIRKIPKFHTSKKAKNTQRFSTFGIRYAGLQNVVYMVPCIPHGVGLDALDTPWFRTSSIL
jgi:hypothetical protein